LSPRSQTKLLSLFNTACTESSRPDTAMAWGKEVEVQRSKGMDAARKKAAAAAAGASSKTKLVKVQEKPPHKGLSSIVVLGAAGLLVGVRLCLRYKDEIRDTLRRLAKGRGDDSSNFRFPGVGRKANEGKAKAYRKAGAGTPVNTSAPRPVPAGQRDDTASSLPRNKASNNKKNKERKKGARGISFPFHPVCALCGDVASGASYTRDVTCPLAWCLCDGRMLQGRAALRLVELGFAIASRSLVACSGLQ
jgi:hypothetical protein